MKRAFILLLVTIGIIHANCTDPFLVPAGTSQNLASFNMNEQKIVFTLKETTSIIETQIKKEEENNQKSIKALNELQKTNLLNYQNQNFTLQQQNELQSIINNLKGSR